MFGCIYFHVISCSVALMKAMGIVLILLFIFLPSCVLPTCQRDRRRPTTTKLCVGLCLLKQWSCTLSWPKLKVQKRWAVWEGFLLLNSSPCEFCLQNHFCVQPIGTVRCLRRWLYFSGSTLLQLRLCFFFLILACNHLHPSEFVINCDESIWE